MTLAFSWLDSDASLAQACDQWLQLGAIFVDTEFVRRTTFYPKLGLIQVSDGEQHWLILPDEISDWSPFCAVLTAASVMKVMHSASEDIDVFASQLKVLPRPLFDTQIASAIAGVGAGLGFAKMVEHVTGVVVDKGATTSDWLARPLSDKQCQYAVADVAYLAPCYEFLQARLAPLQRLDWVLEDSQRLIDDHPCFLPSDQMFRRVKGVGKLAPRWLVVCQYVAKWRDETAKALNRPRARVLKDHDLLAIAQRAPADISQLPRSEFVTAKWVRRFGDDVMAAIAAATALPQEAWPVAMTEPDTIAKQCYQNMRTVLQQHAKTMELPEQAIASKKELFSLIKQLRLDGSATELFQGWRQALFDDLAACCRESSSENTTAP